MENVVNLSNKIVISVTIKKLKNISVQCIKLTKVGPGKKYVYLVGWAYMYMFVKLGLFRHSSKIYICYNQIKISVQCIKLTKLGHGKK